MYDTYYLSRLSFEILLSLTAKDRILVPTNNVLMSAPRGDVYMQLGAMVRNGFIHFDETEQKITVEPEILEAFKQIAASKGIVVLRSQLKSGGMVCLYCAETYVSVEFSALRPDRVKLSFFEDELLSEYLNDIPWLSGEDELFDEEIEQPQEDSAESRNGLFLSAKFYVGAAEDTQEEFFVLNENGKKKLLLRNSNCSCSSRDYRIEKLIEKLRDFFEKSLKEESDL